jgi:septal ring factor EnvC (AmiA/AmiB activator)
MLKSLADLIKQLLSLTRDTQENKAQIKELQTLVRELSRRLELLAFEVQRLKENEVHEREKMALRLELALVRFEHRLPPARQEPEPNPDES